MKKIILFLAMLLSGSSIIRAAIYDTFEYDGLRYMITSEGQYNYYDEHPPMVVVTWQVEPAFRTGAADEPSLLENYYCKWLTEGQNYPGLESVTIPGSVEYNGKTYIVKGIGDYAFHGCSNLTTVIITNGINHYNPETGSFDGPEDLIYILGQGAFIESGLLEVTLKQGLYEIKNDCFLLCPMERFTCLGTVLIGSQAFAGTELKRVVLDEKRELSGNNTFVCCEELKYVVIKKEYSPYYNISASHFQGCHNLLEFSVDENNGSYADIDGVLFNKECTKLIAFPGGKGGNYTIPDGVKEIAFLGMTRLPHLESITIPESVTTIGKGGISRCDSLKRIITRNPVPITFTLNDAMFIHIDHDNCTLYVPIGTSGAYKEAFAWKDFTHILEFNPENPGDVNVDGKVNVSDVTELVNMILGVVTLDDVIGDVNGDGKVNVSDVTALINLILGVK